MQRHHSAGGLALITLVVLMSTAGCVADTQTPADTLLEAITSGKAPSIVDVRTHTEYADGHVPGAIHIPFHEIWLRRAELPAAKTDPIVVYCSHGPRAGVAEFQLWILGYQNIAHLQGQMSGWKRRGLPQETALNSGDAR